MLTNILPLSPSPLSLQPRWLTLGGRGLLGNVMHSTVFFSLCYSSSLPNCRQDCCSCHCFLPFFTVERGCTETLSANFSQKISPPSSPLWIFAVFFHQLFTAMPLRHCCCHLSAPGPRWTNKKQTGSMLAGSHRNQK